MKKKNTTLAMNQMTPGIAFSGHTPTTGCQPPKNSTCGIAQMSTMFTYSAMKNNRNGVEEYSTKYPATSSDSASGRSKGGRFVSARPEMKNMTNIGNSGPRKNQCRMSGPCARTMSDRFNDPASNRTVIRMKPMETS